MNLEQYYKLEIRDRINFTLSQLVLDTVRHVIFNNQTEEDKIIDLWNDISNIKLTPRNICCHVTVTTKKTCNKTASDMAIDGEYYCPLHFKKANERYLCSFALIDEDPCDKMLSTSTLKKGIFHCKNPRPEKYTYGEWLCAKHRKIVLKEF